MNARQPKISGYIITLNEAHQIKDCLATLLTLCDEVVVGDMHSTDGTAEICKKMGAKVIPIRRAPVCSDVQQEIVDQLQYDWILNLDADERLPESLSKRIKELLAENPQPAVYNIPLKNIIYGKVMRHSGLTNYKGFLTLARFFYKDLVKIKPLSIHQAGDLRAKPLPIWRNVDEMDELALLHLWSPTVNHFIYKMARYTNSEFEMGQSRAQTRPAPYKLITSPLKDFFSRFFLQKGFLDGSRGLEICLMFATYQFYRVLKLRNPDYVGEVIYG